MPTYHNIFTELLHSSEENFKNQNRIPQLSRTSCAILKDSQNTKKCAEYTQKLINYNYALFTGSNFKN